MTAHQFVTVPRDLWDEIVEHLDSRSDAELVGYEYRGNAENSLLAKIEHAGLPGVSRV